jgi:hypothetical protein
MILRKEMGQPYKNNEIREVIKRLLKLEMYTDKVPAEIENKIQLVVDVNPLKNEFCNIVRTNGLINNTSATVYSTPTDKDFYLTNATLSYIKDVTSTATYVSMIVTIGGTVVDLLKLPSITLTVGYGQIAQSYYYPIKIDRGTSITVNSSTNVANITVIGNIQGFTVDDRIYDMGIGAQKA